MKRKYFFITILCCLGACKANAQTTFPVGQRIEYVNEKGQLATITVQLDSADLGVKTLSESIKFPVDTIMKNGSPDKYINFVVMGDGFTANEQDVFYSHASNLLNKLFEEEYPFCNYKNFFNTYAIRVVSNESGITHPKTASDCSSMAAETKDTYLGCTFDKNGIHRLLSPVNNAKAFQVLATNMPQYSQAFILCNSTEYGGAGGAFATSSLNSSAFEIIRHELAHSFADLGDEYWAGDGYAAERPNITKQNDPALVKWKNWIGVNNVGLGKIGIYPFDETALAKTYYRPHQM
jgi:hypothetical protein